MPVPTFNIEGASGGNQALRNVLQQLASAVTKQQKATATSPNKAPSQQATTVTFENPLFVVTFTTQQASTQQQAAQQAALGATAGAQVIYNQVRAATTLLFDSASNVRSYGGDNGSPQSEFVIADLDPALGWYFQVRSSFDGNTWNQWKTINGGKPVNANANGVSFQPVANGGYATFQFPGATTAVLGVSQVFDQLSVPPGPGTTILSSLGIAGPNGFNDTGRHAVGINASISETGVVTQEYVDSGGNTWQGTAACLLFGWGDTGQKPTIVKVAGGTFAIFTLPGGNQLAIGSGSTPNGGTFDLPAGFNNYNAMAIPAPGSVSGASGTAHGIAQAQITPASGSGSSMSVAFLWGDGDTGSEGGTWGGNAEWFCVAWSQALQVGVVAVTGGQYIVLNTPSGKLAIGMGTCASGAVIPLPAGFTWQDANLAIKAFGYCTPASTSGSSGNDLHGITLCSVNASGQTILIYADGSGHQWTGNVNWCAVAWL